MQNLRSLFIRANDVITAYPTGEQFHLDDIDDPYSFFEQRLHPSLMHYDHIACDVTDNCNLRCPFCINNFANASSVRMRPEQFTKLIQMAPLGNDQSVFISCLCEPLLHPRLLDLLHMIPRNLRDKFFLTTNLSTKHLDESFLAELMTVELHHVNVSVDSLQKSTFEQMRVNAKYDVFMKNLDKLAKVFAEAPNPPEFRFITVAARSNLFEIPSLVEIARERYGIVFHEVRYPFEEGTPEGTWAVENLLTNDEWTALVSQVTALKYWTHVSKGSLLLVCGFGQQKPAPAAWGPSDDMVESNSMHLPWYLHLLVSLGPVWNPLRKAARKYLRRWFQLMPTIDIKITTPSGDGILRIPSTQGIEAFGMTANNMGHGGAITVIPKASDRSEVMAMICATEQKTGICLAAPRPSITTQIEHKAERTFSIFVRRQGGSGLLNHRKTRIDILFMNEQGKLCGAARVAVKT